MTLNQNIIDGKWLEIRGEVQKSWGKLTNNDLDKTKGDIKAIGGLIQQRYGAAQDIYSKKLAEIFQRFENQDDNSVELSKKVK